VGEPYRPSQRPAARAMRKKISDGLKYRRKRGGSGEVVVPGSPDSVTTHPYSRIKSLTVMPEGIIGRTCS